VALDHFALAITLIPEGRDMRYETHSGRLIEQWTDMMHWKSVGYVGLDREKCIPQWAEIMQYVDKGRRGVQLVKAPDEGNDSMLIEDTQLYATEAVPRLDEP
jgi:hypothetical protein